MAEHEVRIHQVPVVSVLHKDLVISIHSYGELLGKIKVSKGGVGWKRTKQQRERHFTWEQFDRMVREYRG